MGGHEFRSARRRPTARFEPCRQIPCVILDISERGGALRITDPDQPCPTLFTLKPLDGPERLCEVRWRRGDRIGIELR